MRSERPAPSPSFFQKYVIRPIDAALEYIHTEGQKIGQAHLDEFNAEAWRSFHDSVYSASGFDPVDGSLNGLQTESSKRRQLVQAYLKNWRTRVATFLGLPTYLSEADLEKGQSWPNIGRQFVGYKESRGWWNVLTVPFFTIFNFITLPAKLILNITRLITEYLPHYLLAASALVFGAALGLAAGLLRKLFTEEATTELEEGSEPNRLESIGLAMLSVIGIIIASIVAIVTLPIVLIAAIAEYVGRSFTSPFNAIREDWKAIQWQAKNPKKSWFANWVSRPAMFALAIAAVGVRILTIAAIWTAIATAAAPAVGAVAPAITAQLPFLAPVFSGLANTVAIIAQFTAGIVPATLGVIPVAAAQAFVVGMFAGALAGIFAIVGPVVKPYVSMFTNWLHKEAKREPQPDASATSASTHSDVAQALPVLAPGDEPLVPLIPTPPLNRPESNENPYGAGASEALGVIAGRSAATGQPASAAQNAGTGLYSSPNRLGALGRVFGGGRGE